MKFFHLSDLHIGLKLMNRDLREDQEYILDEITELARRERPDAVVIAGDIYDKAVPSAEAVEVFDRFLVGLTEAVPDAVIMMISGNHDSAPRVNCFRKVLSGQNLMTWLSLIAVVVVHIFLYKTPMGLKIRAVGENKNAAESVGISSKKIQYIALVLSGILCSMGGYFLSGGYMNMFTKDMSAGKGFIALAASSMGADTPIGGFLVTMLFGIAQALGNLMQLTTIPTELIQMIPYLTTLIGLAVYSYAMMKRKNRLGAHN